MVINVPLYFSSKHERINIQKTAGKILLTFPGLKLGDRALSMKTYVRLRATLMKTSANASSSSWQQPLASPCPCGSAPFLRSYGSLC